MKRLELNGNFTRYVNIFNIWMRFRTIEDQKSLQRTVYITANTQTPNAWKLQLHKWRVSAARGFFCSFWKKWTFLSDLKSPIPVALSFYNLNVTFTLFSSRWKLINLVPNSAVSYSGLKDTGFIYMSIFKSKHCNVIQIWSMPLSVRSFCFALWWSLICYF